MVAPRVGRRCRRRFRCSAHWGTLRGIVAAAGIAGFARGRFHDDFGRERLRETRSRASDRRRAGRRQVSRRIRQRRGRHDVWIRSRARARRARHRSDTEHRARAPNRRGLARRSLRRAADADRGIGPAHVSRLRLSADRRRGCVWARGRLLRRPNGVAPSRSRA